MARELRRRAADAVVRAGRSCFKGTAVGRLPLAGTVLRWFVQAGHGDGEVLAAFRGLELAVPTASASIAAGLLGGFYEERELDLFEQLCARRRTVVDVGANLGAYACLAARAMPADGLLVCYEPAPGNLARLEANLRRNPGRPGPAVRIEPHAVGPCEGRTTLRLAEDIGLHRVAAGDTAGHGGGGGGGLAVRQVALDARLPVLFAEHGGPRPVDVLKIDVEGYDVHALRGARRLLVRDRPVLFAEFCPPQLAGCGADAEEFVELLAEAYEEIHVVDTARRTVTACAPSALLAPTYRSRLVNVVAAGRDEDRALLARWAGRKARGRSQPVR
ncbi:FkbM family methyltransferase [Kitasatospora sp. NA04385]|uniref:FkbM family methyltransferase n=1 Tax=Kitasatospora sp. NA04385 TaxID=2742135 RepID=UPI00158FF37D|nr:FkbM family methyltransferase [Kitasatospora sp. NA04385]QKW23324.1 FkbM family methyltransferase [Kitasatospora sp. NA04385]